MIDPAIVGVLMFPAVVGCLLLGYPVAFTLSGVNRIGSKVKGSSQCSSS